MRQHSSKFITKLAAGVVLGLGLTFGTGAQAAGDAIPLPQQDWTHTGSFFSAKRYFGTYDLAAAQRGFQVFKEVCAGCHSLKHIAFRHLEGLGYNEDEIKAIAAGYKVADLDDAGEPIERNALPKDHWPSPFPNVLAAAAANGGKAPPDLSLMVDARPDGENYVHAILTGYEEAPAGFKLGEGQHYNKYFPGHVIAMGKPLADGQVTFADGTANTVDQMAKDVTVFLSWTAEPNLTERKQMGVKAIIFLFVMSIVLFFSYRQVWSDQVH